MALPQIRPTHTIKTIEEPLLMTASFHPKNVPFLKLQDSNERKKDYLCALISWITQSPFSKIVFVENTGTDFDFSEIIQLAKKHVTTLEILSYNENSNSQKFGKGYGEGELMKHAFEHSVNLREATQFYKITGRLFIDNFSEIEKKFKKYPTFFFGSPAGGSKAKSFYGKLRKIPARLIGKISAFFLRQNPLLSNLSVALYLKILKISYGSLSCDTIFFKCNVQFFKENLINIYTKVNDHENHPLEACYEEALTPFPMFLFWKPKLKLVGRSGTANSIYKKYYSKDVLQKAQRLIEKQNSQ